MSKHGNFKKNKSNKKTMKGGDSTSQSKFANIQPILAKPLEVKVYGNNLEKALKMFRALVQKERILSTYKEKQFYEKPSVRRRRKRNEASRKALELESKSLRNKNDFEM